MENLEVFKANVKVIGIGDCGNNIISSLKQFGIKNAEIIAVNTDSKKLVSTNADKKYLFGEHITKGFGTGSNAELGKRIAYDEESKIREILNDTDLAFFIVGLGKGTGSGMLPVFAEIAKEMDVLSISLLIYPSRMEGGALKRRADKTIKEIEGKIDSYIIIENDKVKSLYGQIPLYQAFEKTNKIVANLIGNLISTMFEPSDVNIDFADVCTILRNTGFSTMSYLKDKIDNPENIAKKLLNNPLISMKIESSKNILVHYSLGKEVPLKDIIRIQEFLGKYVEGYGDVKYGVRIDNSKLSPYEIEIFSIFAGVKIKEEKDLNLGIEKL